MREEGDVKKSDGYADFDDDEDCVMIARSFSLFSQSFTMCLLPHRTDLCVVQSVPSCTWVCV